MNWHETEKKPDDKAIKENIALLEEFGFRMVRWQGSRRWFRKTFPINMMGDDYVETDLVEVQLRYRNTVMTHMLQMAEKIGEKRKEHEWKNKISTIFFS